MSTTNQRIKKVCEFCGQEFWAQKLTTSYCSRACSSRAYKRALRQRQIEEATERRSTTDKSDISSRQFLSVKAVAELLGVTVRSVYNLIYNGVLQAAHLSSRMTLIHRSDLDRMVDGNPYQRQHRADRAAITEFYTTAEVMAKFGVSNSWVFKVGKEEDIPRTLRMGKTLWSQRHFDAYFARHTWVFTQKSLANS